MIVQMGTVTLYGVKWLDQGGKFQTLKMDWSGLIWHANSNSPLIYINLPVYLSEPLSLLSLLWFTRLMETKETWEQYCLLVVGFVEINDLIQVVVSSIPTF